MCLMAYFTFQMLHLKVLCYLLNLLPQSVYLTLNWNDAAFWEMSAPTNSQPLKPAYL